MSWGTASVASLFSIVVATAILIAGVVDDLRTRKFHNWLFLVCAAVALVTALAVGGLSSFGFATLGFVAGFAVFLPLVLLGIVGAGDMKLMAAFGLVAGWNAVISVAIYSLIWGAIFGLVRTIIRGQLTTLLKNMFAIVAKKNRQPLELQTMPFTVALLVGWLTHLVYQGVL